MSLPQLLKCIDNDAPSLATMPYMIKENHNGRLYGVHVISDIGASSTVYISMKMSATRVTHMLPPVVSSNRTCYIYYGRGATVTDGTGSDLTSTIISNNHLNIITSTQQSFRVGVTVTNDGTIFYSDVVSSGRFSSGSGQDNIGWILAKDTVYIAKLINQDAQAGWVKFSLFWTEALNE
jgi:hypothetical protein